MELLHSYILEADALAYLYSSRDSPVAGPANSENYQGDVSSTLNAETTTSPGTYERILLHGYPHLCFIPGDTPNNENNTAAERSAADGDKELDNAISRGFQLLQGMASNQCLYYTTGWWTYSFCYNAQITQFHALPPGPNGRAWPPQEDPTTPSYVLGKFEKQKSMESPSSPDSDRDLSTEVKSQADTNYLVQRLEGGTPCDLTGNNRKIEVQFHCNPQLTDRIGWIKETATCAYMMIIYTPRLCNDVAFQPPKESRAHSITCQEIISEDDVESWEAEHEDVTSRQALGQSQSQQIILGNVEVGAMKHVGREGKRLERGRIVLTQDEKAETVIMQKNGQISRLSKAELKKRHLSPDEVEAFGNEIKKYAGGKDWKIERLDDVNGHVQLRGVVAADDDDEEDEIKQTPPEDAGETSGSHEEYEEDV